MAIDYDRVANERELLRLPNSFDSNRKSTDGERSTGLCVFAAHPTVDVRVP